MAYIELNVLNSNPSQLALGIDLGTTNSLAAVWRDGRPMVLKPDGRSALSGSADGALIVWDLEAGTAREFADDFVGVDLTNLNKPRTLHFPD